jgi:hypothetical protein
LTAFENLHLKIEQVKLLKGMFFLVVINKIWDDKYIKNTTKILTLLKMITIKSLKLNVKKLFSKMSI